MYFKELEVQGFKSFLNRTKFRFQPGVTAIVGPNGCGKSNVVDAIKWVLGEQSSKSMRSTSMTEVIFNGTQQHDPVNVAEVHLTLSNEDRILPVDYDEVTIGRRLYRSGESEYLLNKVPVRLIDIRQLLMGTGIGTSSYSIVEQGKMDQLISSRPEERRHVFEEASGITRYKAKKHQAELKLERTKDNLTRLNDIISEVERQIRAIERKAKKAERYNKFFSELKDLEVKDSCRKYDALGRNELELGATGSGLAEESTQIKGRLEEVLGSLEELKKRLKDVENSLFDLRQAETRTGSDLERNRDLINIHSERIDELEKQVERLDSEIDSDIEEKEQLGIRCGGMSKRLEDVSSRRGAQQEVLEEMEKKVKAAADGMHEAKHELNMGRELMVDIVTRRSQLENLMVKIDTDMRNSTSHKRRLLADRKDVAEELGLLKQECASVTDKMQGVTGELENLTREYASLKSDCAGAALEIDELKNTRAGTEKELNEIKPRREFLQKLISEREGIDDPVKRVLQKAEEGEDIFQGVRGILSELISVDPHYDQTLEAALGDVSQAIVVDDRQTADKVVDFLQEQKLGSVNLLIIDELAKLNAVRDRNLGKGTLDDITQIFSAAEPFSSALRTYLSDTFVTVSPEAARYFVTNTDDFQGSIMCECGEIHKKGSHRSRNYSNEQNVSILGRQEKVNNLLSREEELTSNIVELDLSIEGKRVWLNKSLERKEQTEVSLRDVERRYSEVGAHKKQIESKLVSFEEELTVIDSEISEMDDQLEMLNEKKEQTTETINKTDLENARISEDTKRLQEQIQHFSQERETHVFELADIRAAFNALSSEEETLSSAFQRDKASFDRLDQKIGMKRDRIEESSVKIEELKSRIENLRMECEKQEEGLVELKKQSSSESELRDSLEQDLRRLELEAREKEQSFQRTQESSHDLDMRKKEIEYQKKALADHIHTVYSMDITVLNMDSRNVDELGDVSERISWLRDRIDRMGTVSLDAVDEQEELKKRYEFLISQRDDLLQSKAAVIKAIKEINATTKKQFMETFSLIRDQFNLYFRMLFNGGKAEIVLQDEKDVLECGIDIIVRPPGKKLHNVMQLSGGEKALTAIALIFAIFKVNPSPFCFLDEIDAPLDESNIMRFTRVLQEFLKLSQFVVITHNRLTIQLAEALYGVTMQEKGVSKVVSVKFREEDESLDPEIAAAAV